MKPGYARISTENQNPAMQLAALKKARCKTVFKDEVNGQACAAPCPHPTGRKPNGADQWVAFKNRPLRTPEAHLRG